jgi:hypothetical protein
MDLTPFIYTAATGAVGGLAYSYYYKLLSMATYLSALGHIGAGAVAALITVATGALGAPTDQGSFLLLAAIGYGGTDVIDSFVQKLQSTPSTTATGTTPPPAA